MGSWKLTNNKTSFFKIISSQKYHTQDFESIYKIYTNPFLIQIFVFYTGVLGKDENYLLEFINCMLHWKKIYWNEIKESKSVLHSRSRLGTDRLCLVTISESATARVSIASSSCVTSVLSLNVLVRTIRSTYTRTWIGRDPEIVWRYRVNTRHQLSTINFDISYTYYSIKHTAYGKTKLDKKSDLESSKKMLLDLD